MISNLYSWIFLAAVFAAAGLRNLSSNIKRKRNPERARSNRIVWFSINISLVFCVLAGSAFFVNWTILEWSMTYVYFAILAVTVFYLGFVFKLKILLPVIFFLIIVILFFKVYLKDWKVIPVGGTVANYRILAKSTEGLKVEIYEIETDPLFIEGTEFELPLVFDVLKIDRSLFFIGSGYYYRMIDPSSDPRFSDKLISFLAGKTFLLDEKRYSIDIGKEALLYKYSIVIDVEKKKISIEN